MEELPRQAMLRTAGETARGREALRRAKEVPRMLGIDILADAIGEVSTVGREVVGRETR